MFHSQFFFGFQLSKVKERKRAKEKEGGRTNYIVMILMSGQNLPLSVSVRPLVIETLSYHKF